MLINNYTITNHKVPNNLAIYNYVNSQSSTQNQTTPTFKIPSYPTPLPTIPFSEFPSLTPYELDTLFNEQLDYVTEQTTILNEYNLLSTYSKNLTIQFYTSYYVHDEIYTLNKAELSQYIATVHARSNTITQKPQSQTSTSTKHSSTQHSQPTQTISLQAIRTITWYTTNPLIQHPDTKLPTPTHIKWQETLLTLAHDPDVHEIVIDGSRQMWKSKTTAEILVESSFLPNFHQLVAAPSQDLTNLIKNYIHEYIQPFEDNLFITKAKERYIINTFSGSRIHFLTLKDEGNKALWLTLKRIIVDEAQFVSIPTVSEALKPTMTTTNGQLILIWTAIADTTSYMYSSLMEARKWNTDIKYITVSADNNPFITPATRKQIQNDLNNPMKKDAVLRQYYNKWGGWENKLFSPTIIPLTQHTPHPEATIIIAIDPARHKDKSAYSILHVTENSCITIESWEIPETHKKDWTLQRHFMLNILNRYKSVYARVITTMDWTGIGDWVVTIFEQGWYPINYVIKYTSSDTTTISKTEARTLRVGKSVLINNTLDLMTENIHSIIDESTQSLQEEINFLEADYDSMWKIRMKSSFYDDEVNALMLTLYISTKMWIHSRPTKSLTFQNQQHNNKAFIEEVKQAYPEPRRRQRQQRTNYF